MDRCCFITYNNKNILYIDFSKLTGKKLIDFSKETEQFIEKYPKKSLVVLCYVKGFRYSSETNNFLKEYVSNTQQYVKAIAIVGLSTMYKMMLEFMGNPTSMEIRLFDNEEEAKKWLSLV